MAGGKLGDPVEESRRFGSRRSVRRCGLGVLGWLLIVGLGWPSVAVVATIAATQPAHASPDLDPIGLRIAAGAYNSPGSVDGEFASARFVGPNDIAVSPDGSAVYVTESSTGAVRRLDLATSSVSTLTTGVLVNPREIDVASDGNVYVSGSSASGNGNGYIARVAPSGTVTMIRTGVYSTPRVLLSADESFLWSSDWYSKSCYRKYYMYGNLVTVQFDGTTTRQGVAPGPCNYFPGLAEIAHSPDGGVLGVWTKSLPTFGETPRPSIYRYDGATHTRVSGRTHSSVQMSTYAGALYLMHNASGSHVRSYDPAALSAAASYQASCSSSPAPGELPGIVGCGSSSAPNSYPGYVP